MSLGVPLGQLQYIYTRLERGWLIDNYDGKTKELTLLKSNGKDIMTIAEVAQSTFDFLNEWVIKSTL